VPARVVLGELVFVERAAGARVRSGDERVVDTSEPNEPARIDRITQHRGSLVQAGTPAAGDVPVCQKL